MQSLLRIKASITKTYERYQSVHVHTRSNVFIVIGLVISLPFLFWSLGAKESERKPLRVIFTAILMGFYWITEAIPLPVTSLLPLVLFPFLKILTTDEVSAAYFNDTIFLFLGSFIVAAAMEKWMLHKRIALKLLLMVGNRPRGLLLGFIMVTAFLSMWMSNTSTAGLMVPLVMTTLTQLKEQSTPSSKSKPQSSEESALLTQSASLDDTASSEEPPSDDLKQVVLDDSPQDEDDASSKSTPIDDADRILSVERYSKAVLLGVAYSASLGGTATLIGTGPNLVLKQQMKNLFPEAPEISFLQWLLFASPLSFVLLMILWAFLCFVYVRKPEHIHFNLTNFRQDYLAMGKIRVAEMYILGALGTMIILWSSRVGLDEHVPGWGYLFENYPGDGTVAMLLGFLLFVAPSRSRAHPDSDRVMDWEAAQNIPWGIILLLGSGFALAKGFHVSGLSVAIGKGISSFEDIDSVLLVFLTCGLVTFTTEVTSNVAISNIALPILAAIAIEMRENPLLFMIPATISCSFAFMLPVATPPNAIVFASGNLKVVDMAKPGFVMNVVGVILLPCIFLMIGLPIFGIELGSPPSWLIASSEHSHE